MGKELVRQILVHGKARRIIVFSRDEVKQLEMRSEIGDPEPSILRYFIGDVRDRERLYRAFQGGDIVIHSAALKQVPTAEYNPLEVIKTNVLGGANVIDAAIDCGVKKVIALSTDKAVNPVNLYGASKLCSDKLFVAAGVYSGAEDTRFAVVRYGNVMGSRGSVIPLFIEKKESGRLPITDKRMTRFWITVEGAAKFVLQSLNRMDGGEIFVPKLPTMKIVDIAAMIAPGCEFDEIGIRPGEKLHEVLITEEEARRTCDMGDSYVVKPGSLLRDWSSGHLLNAVPVSDDFRYSSDSLQWQVGGQELEAMLGLKKDRKSGAKVA